MSTPSRTPGKRTGDFGFNARIEEFEKPRLCRRVIDPAKVVRSVMENAVSAAFAAHNHRGGGHQKKEAGSHARDAPGGSMGEWAVWTISEATIFSINGNV